MCRRALIVAPLILLAGCGHPEPTVIYKPVEVQVPVAVPCPAPDVYQVQGPDFAPQESTIFEAAQYVAARIEALRAEITGLRAALAACTE